MLVPLQRPDQAGGGHHQQHCRPAAAAVPLAVHAEAAGLAGRGGPLHRDGAADQLEGLHIGDPLAPTPDIRGGWTTNADGAVLRQDRQGRHHHGLYPQGPAAGGLRHLDPGGAWRYANVDDLGAAAKQWPQIDFVIYHSALRAFLEDPQVELAKFEQTGRIEWVSDLAEIPAKFGVRNVYCDIGTSFAVSAVSNPRFCAAMMGTLVKGLGHDHIFWGTDAVWYGSPQWQIEALRRLEIPEDMQKRFGFVPLGPADGPMKSDILGYNAARHYRLDLAGDFDRDGLGRIKAAYLDAGEVRTNLAYGFVVPRG